MMGLIALGTYMMVKLWGISVETVNFIPLVSFSWAILISSLGIQTLLFTIISEIMPGNIKEACVAQYFINMKYLPLLIDTIGFHGAMYMFAGVCLIGVTILNSIMPETKGKSHEEIMKSLE